MINIEKISSYLMHNTFHNPKLDNPISPGDPA